MKNFKNRTVLITGGSSGIGLALGKQFASKGAHVWILARRKNLLKSAQKEIRQCCLSPNQNIEIISADVSKYDELKTALQSFIKEKGVPDILINSAGISYPGTFLNLESKIFDDTININYLGTVYPTKIIAPEMVKQGHGHIVNLSSLAAIVGIYGYSAYAPSKYAVRGFSRVLRAELNPHGISVSIVYPPDTDTPQLAFENKIKPEITKAITQGGGLLSADKVASDIIKGIEKDKFTIIPGLEGKLLVAFAPIIGRILYHSSVKKAKQTIKKN